MVFVPTAATSERAPLLRSPLSLLSVAALLFAAMSVASPVSAADKKEKAEKATEEPKADKSEADAPEGGEADGDTPKASASAGPAGVVAALPAPVPDEGGPGNTIIFIDGGFRSDLTLLLQREEVGRLAVEEDFDVKSSGPMFHIGLLTKLFWKFRIGFGLGYGWKYHFKERLTDFEIEQEQEPEEWTLGQLHTADLRLEFSQKLTTDFYVVATPRGGVQAIVVGEDLRSESRALRESHNVRTGPQLGALGGIDVGVRYVVTPWFSVRGTAGYAYYTQGLLRAKRRGDAADSKVLWRMSGARVGSNIALEASF